MEIAEITENPMTRKGAVVVAVSYWKRRFRLIRLATSFGSVLIVAFAGLQLIGVLPRLQFGTRTVDRSQPALLRSIRDLSQYHAAVGDFQVVVDVEHDVRYVPAFLAGDRTFFIAAGTVDAYVDLGSLADGALSVSADRHTISIRLPQPMLARPNLDQSRTYVVAESRGLLNRLVSVFSTADQHELYVFGQEKISDAAAKAGLVERAAKNTRAMLAGMLGSLGFQVTFVGGG